MCSKKWSRQLAFLMATLILFFAVYDKSCVYAYAAETAPEVSEAAVEGGSLSDPEIEAETDPGTDPEIDLETDPASDLEIDMETDPDVDENNGISFGDDDLFSVPVNDGSDPDVDSFGNAYGPAEGVTWGAVDPDEETTAVVDAAFAYPDSDISFSDNFDPETGMYTDLEISDSNIFARYQKSLEYFPLTDYEKGIESNSIIGSLTLTFFSSLLISWGVKVASGALSSLFTKFLTLARERFGDNEACMTALDKLASLKAGVVLEIGLIKTMFVSLWDDLFGDNGKTYTTDGSDKIVTEPFNKKIADYVNDYNSSHDTSFVYSGASVYDEYNNKYFDFILPNSNCELICFYVYDNNLEYCYYDKSTSNYTYSSAYFFTTIPSSDGYEYSTSISSLSLRRHSESQILAMANNLSVPLFKSYDYAKQYVNYAQTDGMYVRTGTTYNNTDTSAIASQVSTAKNVVVQDESAYADIVNDAADDEDDDAYIARVVAAVLALLGISANVNTGSDTNTGSSSDTTDVTFDDTNIVAGLASLLTALGPLPLILELLQNFPSFSDLFQSVINTILSIPGLFEYLFQWILDALASAADSVVQAVTSIPEAVGGFIDNVGNALDEDLDELIKDVIGLADLLGLAGLIDLIINAIKSIPNSFTDLINSIVNAITNLGAQIEAIPQTIIDFFTIDSEAVSQAFEGLEDDLLTHFGGIVALSEVFNQSYSFDQDIPVFTVAVPAELQKIFNGATEITVMDLRPYADIFHTVRALVSAALWLLFAKWLLDQFDVKLHVG